jgi:hypothetical protein
MRRMIVIACALAMISGEAQAQASGSQANAPQKPHASMRKTKKASAKKPAPVAAAAPPAQPVPARVVPPVPATLMNSAPVNADVTMTNGLLTIDAPNSTLGDVLRGVHNATGAEIEGASPTDRVAVRLGPGDPRQVIAALLEGTPYDYLILGSQEKPNAVTRIVLTQSSGGASAGASAQNGPPNRSQPPMPQPSVNEDSQTEDTATQPAGENPAEQTQPPPAQPEQNTPNAQSGTNGAANGPKTPEELFKQLMPAQPAQPANQSPQP